MTVLSAVFAGLAAAMLFPASGSLVRQLVARPPGDAARSLHLFAAVCAIGGGLVVIVDGTTLVLGLIAVVASAAATRLLAGGRQRRAAIQREARVLEMCEVLVAELRSGQPPVTALEHCVEVWPELEPVVTAARFDADVPAALRRLAGLHGAAELRAVAAAWTVAQGTGSGLAVALGQVAESAREAQATRRLVTGELASAQATARLVAALPVVTLVMGSGIGGDPWGFLLRSPAGLVCLAVGLLLAFLGLAWIDRIATMVTRR
jgi:tight adherence protein B